MRKKLTFAGLSLALAAAALISGARSAQATNCVTYYCTDTGCCYSCCFFPGREICTEPCGPGNQ
jgi:hypothetical protein